jgi:histone H1/5
LITLKRKLINLIFFQAAKPAKAKKPAKKSEHPATAVMVAAAITTLKDKKGSSRQAIKKYIAATYKVDIVKLGPHLKKALKTGVEKKTLVAVKGSFKLAKVEKPKKKKVVKKEPAKKVAKKAKKPAAKKTPKKAKKPAAKKAKTPKKAAAPAKKAKSPKKAAKKPAAKPAAKKPVAKKSPKKAAKKAAPKKK